MTEQEYRSVFSDMIAEITCRDGARYDAMLLISDSFLKPYIKKLMSYYPIFNNLDMSEDIYHDVVLCLIKSSVDGFLYKDGTLNDDAEGYLRWMYTVAKHIVQNNARKLTVKYSIEESATNSEGEQVDIADGSNDYNSLEAAETLRLCFNAALDSDTSVYILFAWILRAIILSQTDQKLFDNSAASERKACEFVVINFGDQTLSVIYAAISVYCEKVSWMKISREANEKIISLLQTENDGILLGDKKLSDFFMKKGGNATVSDWINRMNARIRRTMESDPEKR